MSGGYVIRHCIDVHGSGPSMGWVGLGPAVKFSKNFVHNITVSDMRSQL